MNKPIKTGVLSFGLSGKIFHAPFLAEHSGFEFYGIVERSKNEAQHIYPNVIRFESVEALLANTEIELVVVNTPNYTHFEFAMMALKAQKHVLVEKPFTVTSAEAQQLFEEAKKQQRYVLPYQNRRYDSDFLSLVQVLQSGKLGNLVEVHMRFDRYRYAIGPKVGKETPLPGSGLLYDLGPHLLDSLLSLFGNPLKWTKTTGHFRPHTQVDDYVHIHLEYPNQLQVFVTTSLLVAAPLPSFIVHGTKGSYVKDRTNIQEEQLLAGMSLNDPNYGIEGSENNGVLTLIDADGTKTVTEIIPVKSSYMHVFEDVYQTIREAKPYPVTQAQILKQLEILEG
ncbi:Gfo/Idh/MocA family oxidoreductase [Arenibacter sp. GZD96]|uniref:Gfo/Idh/MocA family protein n=1 Tax=Aurantibrevibacter litoralis TaxID=3106030 RepID=UPI002AFF6B9E|nr:Gfo/Idh/MocA family oxidoreductase [Arenibacter sp. GZD-96]MEA1784749.1 Gfo/Idh/MocA family oxidoreductase [Arenibacter sp. GZD-96]